MTNYFSPKDRLLTYVSQQYLNNRYYYPAVGKLKSQNEKVLARARYFHKFNDQGTELLLVGSYQYTDDINKAETSTKNDATLFIVELNTPLTSHLTMMAGWEGDFSSASRYVASNNDLYLQFNYFVGPMRLTVGDRVMFYHYGTNAVTEAPAHDAGFMRSDGRESYNETRNNLEVSAVASLSPAQQLQAAYHRKFINPGYSVTKELSYEEWEAIRDGLAAQYIDETKLGYTFSQSNFTLSLAAYYQMMERAENRTKLSASAFYRLGNLALTAGVNFVGIKGSGNDYATFHFSPRFTLPYQMQLNVQSIFAAGDKKLAGDNHVYLSGQLCKQLGKHWNFAVEWHDICSSHYSACMGTVQYVF